MPAERAGYTVTMFLVDISPSMGKVRTVHLPLGLDGEERFANMTSLEWALQYVKMKVQDMIFGGRKTEQCGIITFGSETTNNMINQTNGGYDNVYEYVGIGQPNNGTIAKLDALQPSTVSGDPIDALIVGVDTQAEYMTKKKTWTRKIVLVTDGESPIEMENWESVIQKMNALDISFTIVGVDFDDLQYPYEEPGKSVIKRTNEEFYHGIVSSLKNGAVGTCAYALQEITCPDVKVSKSALMGTVLRVGDIDGHPDEAIEIAVKTTKCTTIARPKSWKKFAPRIKSNKMEVDGEEEKTEFAQLRMRTEYYVDDEDIKMEDNEEDLLNNSTMDNDQKTKSEHLEKVEKEELIRGFKYGTTYVPCPDGQFPKLPTRKGIEICGFFPTKNYRRDYAMGEISYVWADNNSPQQQAALSSIVQAMYQKEVVAIARRVTKDGMDPKMGVLVPVTLDKVDCLLWTQVPFADDVRKYSFASLERLVSKKGERLTTHPYLPTKQQQNAMDIYVDAMDLMTAGDQDEEGIPQPWFDLRQSYNPALHRVKQALFHCAVVSDLKRQPLPPPHPELLKYFNTPPTVIAQAKNAVEKCQDVFKVREVPKKVSAKVRRNDHAHAEEEDDGQLLLLDRKQSPGKPQPTQDKGKTKATESEGSATEEEEEEEEQDYGDKKDVLLDEEPTARGQRMAPLPTPARSASPQSRRIREQNMDVDDEANVGQIDPGRIPGRIIGTTDPLKDFRKNLEQGDIVTKAVEDMGFVISDIVMKPFSWRRNSELMECLREMRNVALKEDEIETWNAFMKEFKKKCLKKPGNLDFWKEVEKAGRGLTLISKQEADRYGGLSIISEREARDFLAKH
ncbi:SPOC domain-like protein [Amanita muscaria]